MKIIKFILLCLSLMIATASAKDFHLFVTQVLDNDSKGYVVSSTVYVLVPPDGGSPVAFKTFDSGVMEHTISDIARGGVILYDAGALHSLGDKVPTNAQVQALQAYCKKSGIGFVNLPTN